jgi:hypothetical protein
MESKMKVEQLQNIQELQRKEILQLRQEVTQMKLVAIAEKSEEGEDDPNVKESDVVDNSPGHSAKAPDLIPQEPAALANNSESNVHCPKKDLGDGIKKKRFFVDLERYKRTDITVQEKPQYEASLEQPPKKRPLPPTHHKSNTTNIKRSFHDILHGGNIPFHLANELRNKASEKVKKTLTLPPIGNPAPSQKMAKKPSKLQESDPHVSLPQLKASNGQNAKSKQDSESSGPPC